MHSPDVKHAPSTFHGDLNHQVIIVGGGASGLSLALELGRLYKDSNSGRKLKITILEASSVVGGRVRTIRTTSNPDASASKFLSLTPSRQEYWQKRYEKFSPWTIPLGAEFVHGDVNNPTIMDRIERCQQKHQHNSGEISAHTDWELELVLDYSKKHPNLTIFTDNQCFHWYDGDATVSKEGSNSRSWQSYIHKAKQIWAEILAIKEDHEDMTLDDFINHKYEGLEHMKDEQECILSILNAVYAVTAGTNSNLLGVKETSRQENLWPYGEKNFRLGACYVEFIDELLIELDSLNGCPGIAIDIVTNSPVQEIISTNSDCKLVQVVCKTQQSCHECHCVGVTVPLAVMKCGHIQFTGDCALTDQKWQAIKAINVSPGGKIHALIKWGVDLNKSEQFDCNFLRGIFICPQEDFKQLWFRWNDTSILATAFCVFNVHACDPIHLEESLKNLIMRILLQSMSADIFLKNSDDDPCLTFSAFDVYNWSDDEYIQGMYSSPSPASDVLESASYNRNLEGPISSYVYFAGEHTHTETNATVQSGMESGIKAAHSIYQQLCVIQR